MIEFDELGHFHLTASQGQIAATPHEKTQKATFEAARPLPIFCHSFITRHRGSYTNAGLAACRLLGEKRTSSL